MFHVWLMSAVAQTEVQSGSMLHPVTQHADIQSLRLGSESTLPSTLTFHVKLDRCACCIDAVDVDDKTMRSNVLRKIQHRDEGGKRVHDHCTLRAAIVAAIDAYLSSNCPRTRNAAYETS